jgi:hypothetical protein
MQNGATRPMTSRAETLDVVYDVAGKEAPPNDKGKERGEHGTRLSGLVGVRASPTNPISGQQCEPDSDEVLFEVKEAQGWPMTGAL